MEPSLMDADYLDKPTEEKLVREWRSEQLMRLGLSRVLAQAFADRIDWHALAALVERGCSLEVALEIVR